MPLRIPEDLSKPYTRFGVTIGRLTRDEIELLRQRRNDPEIARYMIFQQEISLDEQVAWFHRVDNRQNLYGTIYWQGAFIGLTNLKDIDHAVGSAEGGMIIWAKEHQNSLVPFRAALVGTDLAFWEYGFSQITCQVLATNIRALRFNRGLGYRFDDPPDARGVVRGTLLANDYWRATRELRATLDAQDGTQNGGEPWPAIIPPLPDDPSS